MTLLKVLLECIELEMRQELKNTREGISVATNTVISHIEVEV